MNVYPEGYWNCPDCPENGNVDDNLPAIETTKGPAITQSAGSYKNFELCLKLRDAGFPQLRRFQSMYYVRPDMLICIDNLSALKSDGKTDFENIFQTLIFKPTLDDIEQESRAFFHGTQVLNDGTVCVYSNMNEDISDIPGRQDPAIRALAPTEWEARAKLYLNVKAAAGPQRTLTPEELDQSENKIEGTINP